MSARHAALDRGRWDRARRACLDRAGWRCERCGAAGRLEVHHRVPLADGGDPFAPDNLSCLCRGCHVAEHRRQPTAEETAWLNFVAELLDSKG